MECEVAFRFPVIKLVDYNDRWAELETSANPFATVVMAHLKAQETRHDPAARQRWKLWLTKRLYKLGYDRQQVLDLFGFVDWVLQLPGPQELAFWQEVQEMEEEKRMRYITSVERIGIQQGIQQGMQQGMQQGQAEMVLRVLGRRFGALPAGLAAAVRGAGSEQMPALLDVALTAGSLEEAAAAVEALGGAGGNGSQGWS